MDTKEQSLYTDSHHETMTDLEDSKINTAHLTNHDPWYQVGFVLVTFMSSAYALGYSKVVMVPLGWVGGTLGLVAVAAISLYANHLLARLHETGGIRHIRYRDLAGHIYGVNSPAKDYEMPGSKENKFFNSVGAVASLVFAYNSGMLPEIQATVKHPHVKNMQKALYLQFTAGIVPFYAVTLVGYWAYGSETSSYLLNNVHGPKWIKAMANAAAFLQSVISQHIFANPVYEYLDTKFGRSNESVYSAHNWTVRLLARGTYLAATTFMAALLPFLGDFISIAGALSTIPLTFVLANHMYIKVKGNDLSSLSKTWHWANIWLFAILAAAATVASVRFILVDSKTYSAFADF